MSIERLVSNLQRVAAKPDKAKPLAGAKPPVPLRDKTKVSAASSTGSGFASPLVEKDYTTRTLHPPRVKATTDSVFSLELTGTKSLLLTDPTGQTVEIDLADKPTTP